MILYVLDGLASHAAMVGRLQRSARLLGAAENLQTETGIRLMPHMEPVLAHARETIVASLGIPTLELETQAGKRMSTDEAIAFALDEKKPARLDAHVDAKKVTPLSKRELQVARLIADGMSNKEIAARVLPFRADRGDARVEHPQQARNQLQGGGCALGRARVGSGLGKALLVAAFAVRPRVASNTRTDGSSATPNKR